jgi:hypothetical protein
LIDPRPLWSNFDAAFLDQAFEFVQLGRAAVRLEVIGDEDLIFEQEPKFWMAPGDLNGFGDDATTAAKP